MPQITVGLIPGKNGFFDPITNFYLSLDKPVQELTYSTPDQLTNITHALLGSVPRLNLYKGELPQEAIDAWKAKFDKMFRSPVTRNLVENGKVIGEVPIDYAINRSVQDNARLAEPNRAFDRADAMEPKGMEAVSLGEAESVEILQAAAVQEPVQEPVKEEAPVEKKAPKRGANKAAK